MSFSRRSLATSLVAVTALVGGAPAALGGGSHGGHEAPPAPPTAPTASGHGGHGAPSAPAAPTGPAHGDHIAPAVPGAAAEATGPELRTRIGVLAGFVALNAAILTGAGAAGLRRTRKPT